MLTFTQFLLEKSLPTHISTEESKKIYDEMNLASKDVDFKEFAMGMNVELEHNNVTHGDLHKIALIALAHLKEVSDYYTRLKKVEGKKGTNESFIFEGSSRAGEVRRGLHAKVRSVWVQQEIERQKSRGIKDSPKTDARSYARTHKEPYNKGPFLSASERKKAERTKTEQ